MKEIQMIKCKKSLFFLILTSFLVLFSACSTEKEWNVERQVVNLDENTVKDKVKVAVLDSGINNLTHLKKNIAYTFNVEDNNKSTSDLFDHGTKIASTIADNKIGINPNVSIYDIQVLNSKGQGTVESICKGIDKSIEQRVDIINMSLGFNKDSKLLRKCVNRALDKNIFIVAASGDGSSDSVNYPADYKGVISVSAIDKDDTLYRFSNKGKIDFVAPGVDVKVIDNEGKIDIDSGSSIAAANFTGVLSLYISSNQEKKIYKEKNIRNIYIKGTKYTFLYYNG